MALRYINKVLYLVSAACLALSCVGNQPFDTRVEKILHEINNPNSDYVVVISHRGDWRNYPENSKQFSGKSRFCYIFYISESTSFRDRLIVYITKKPAHRTGFGFIS